MYVTQIQKTLWFDISQWVTSRKYPGLNRKKSALYWFTILCMLFSLRGYAQFPAPYCSEVFSTVVPITQVQFAGIDNTSSGSSTTAHEDFTGMSGTVYKGGTQSISIKGNLRAGATTYFIVFIDWNQDNDFGDTGERIGLAGAYSDPGETDHPVTGSINIPSTALAGTTRMRVWKKEAFEPACSTNGAGQAEDYTLVVLNPTPPCGTLPNNR